MTRKIIFKKMKQSIFLKQQDLPITIKAAGIKPEKFDGLSIKNKSKELDRLISDTNKIADGKPWMVGDLQTKEALLRHQPHYEQYAIQPVVFIGANNLDFFQGNIIKYICRFRKKNGVQDLEKARHYLDMYIQKESGQEIKP